MDNEFKMRRQYESISVQIKSVSLLIDEIGKLSEEVVTKILDAVSDLTFGEIESKYPDFSSLYPDEYKDLCLIGKKMGQGMSELRSSLDYLVRFLAYANENTPHRRAAFPVLEWNEDAGEKEFKKFLSINDLRGLTCDQKGRIRAMQPAYMVYDSDSKKFRRAGRGAMNSQVETLSAVNLHRNIYMHNAVPEIEPYLVPYPSSKDRSYMDDNGMLCTKHDPNSKIKTAGFEVWVYKDLCRLEKVMARSRLYDEPAKLLSDHKKTIIGIIQQLTSTVDTDFNFEFLGAPYQFKP